MGIYSRIEWTEEFNVGNTQINNEHKDLINLYNKMGETINLGKSTEQIVSVLSELTNYSLNHFKDEEEWMKEINYPEFDIHQREHKDFIYRIAMFNISFSSLDEKMIYEIISFLKEWIVNHLMISDKKIEEFRVNLPKGRAYKEL